MTTNPLAHPTDQQLLQQFASHFDLATEQESVASLAAVARAFSQLPYENLSKIIRHAQTGRSPSALEMPGDVVAGHLSWGTGGTCFSLTATLLHLVRSLGFAAEPILADRPYGADTHCALRVDIDGRPHLLDPGFLLVDPIPLVDQSLEVKTPFHTVSLQPESTKGRLTLATQDGTRRKTRLTFKTDPVDAGQFLRAWEQSFEWDMMRYPVVTKVVGNTQHYLRGSYRQIRSGSQVERAEIPKELLPQQIVEQFGIAPEIVRQALSLIE